MDTLVMVFAHELGHWLIAKGCGLNVENEIHMIGDENLCQGKCLLPDNGVYLDNLNTLSEEDKGKLMLEYLAGPTSDYILLKKTIGEEKAREYLINTKTYWHTLEERSNNEIYTLVGDCAGDLYIASLLDPGIQQNKDILFEYLDYVETILIPEGESGNGLWAKMIAKFLEMVEENEDFQKMLKEEGVRIDIPFLIQRCVSLETVEVG